MTVENKPQTQQNKQDDTSPKTVRINCLTPFLESGRKLKLPLEEPPQEPRRMCITNLIRSYEQTKKPLDLLPSIEINTNLEIKERHKPKPHGPE